MRNPNGVRDHFYETCHEPGHVHGCPGRAGGDHELKAPALKLPPAMTWRSGPDGIGHLLAKPRDHWYLCGFVAVALRLAWPMRERCPECVRVLEGGGRV